MRFLWVLYFIGASLTALSAQSVDISSAGRPVVIGCIGDSITAGSGASSQDPACAQLPKFLNKINAVTTIYSSVNVGVGGTTSGDWASVNCCYLGPAIQKMTAAKVNVVQVMLGTNDSNPNIATPPATFSANLQAMIGSLISAGFEKIILHQPVYISQPYMGQWNVVTSNALIVQYGKVISALAAANPANVFDGDHLGYDWFRINSTDSSDGIHPNDNGHISLGFLWAKAYANLFLRKPDGTPVRIDLPLRRH